jgi:hypothetical protein
MLALSLGRTVAELLDSISSRELSEWQVYYDMQPWGDVRADHRHGILCAQLTTVGTQGRAKPRPADYIPDYLPAPRRPRRSPEELKAAFRAHAAAGSRGKAKPRRAPKAKPKPKAGS